MKKLLWDCSQSIFLVNYTIIWLGMAGLYEINFSDYSVYSFLRCPLHSRTILASLRAAMRRTPRSVCDAQASDILNIGTPSHSHQATMTDEISSVWCDVPEAVCLTHTTHSTSSHCESSMRVRAKLYFLNVQLVNDVFASSLRWLYFVRKHHFNCVRAHFLCVYHSKVWVGRSRHKRVLDASWLSHNRLAATKIRQCIYLDILLIWKRHTKYCASAVHFFVEWTCAASD